MNLSDIFLNNGQLNWDAIGAISNIVLVTALVLITYWYAKKVSEQTDLMVKDRERNKILEEVQDFLTPTIHHLGKEIEYIFRIIISFGLSVEEWGYLGLCMMEMSLYTVYSTQVVQF